MREQDPRVPDEVEEYLVGARTSPGSASDVLQRIAAAFPKAHELAHEEDLVRLALPIGRTGLQHIVVDLVLRSAAGSTDAHATTAVQLRAYGKEGLLSRKPTAATADKVLAALSG